MSVPNTEGVDQLPSAPGAYVLLISVADRVVIRVRRGPLGTIESGSYVYVGSAMGPGGLRARVRRHVVGRRRLHWHIDFLLADSRTTVTGVVCAVSAERVECKLVRTLLKRGFEAPVPGFGNTDCRTGCPAHLLKPPPTLAWLRLVEDAFRSLGLSPRTILFRC